MAHDVRPATEADRERLAKLATMLGHAGDAGAYFRFLDEGPAGKAHTWLAMDAEGKPVAYLTLVPHRIVEHASDGLGAVVVGGAHPSHLGAVHPLARAARDSMGRLGLSVLLGASTPSFHLAACEGAREEAKIARFSRRVMLIPYTRAHLDVATYDDTRVDAIWRSVRARGRGVARDAAFYTWKFLRGPRRVEPFVVMRGTSAVGACALEAADRTLRIVDLLAEPAHRGSALRAILRHARGAYDRVELRLTYAEARDHALWRRAFLASDAIASLAVFGSDARGWSAAGIDLD
jgi:hypothetical protein